MRLKPSQDLVDHLREDLALLRVSTAAQPDPRERRKAYRKFLQACDAMIEFLWLPTSPYRNDPGRTLPPIAELITPTGYGRLFGLDSDWLIRRLPHEGLVRDVPIDVEDRDCTEYVFTMDRLTLHRRASVAVEFGPVLVDKLIREFKAPVQRLLDIDSQGGRPADFERRRVIRVAQMNFRRLTGKRPTRDEGGDFVLFCQDICVELGLETDTLGSLVAEVLYPRVRKRSKKAT